MKFDIKAFDPNIHRALGGTGNGRALDNFRLVAGIAQGTDALCTITLLVPGYVGAEEVGSIAAFIASVDRHPVLARCFPPRLDRLFDLPVTPRNQAEACVAAARQHLNHGHIGNAHPLR